MVWQRATAARTGSQAWRVTLEVDVFAQSRAKCEKSLELRRLCPSAVTWRWGCQVGTRMPVTEPGACHTYGSRYESPIAPGCAACLQERNRLPDVADEELNAPAPEPLRFDIDEPELLDDDMVEILLLPEVSASASSTHMLAAQSAEISRANAQKSDFLWSLPCVLMQAQLKAAASSWPAKLPGRAQQSA